MQRHIWFIFSILIYVNTLWAQENNLYQHLSPVPGSINNSYKSTIIIREGTLIDETSLVGGVIKVEGSVSGEVQGTLLLSDDNKTIIFKPVKPFHFEEQIRVSINGGIKTVYGEILPTFSYSFTIEKSLTEISSNLYRVDSGIAATLRSEKGNKLNSIPKIKTIITNPKALGEGKIFLSSYGVINQSFQSNADINSSVIVANNDGSIFFSKDIGTNKGAGLTDFQMQPNGLMSYTKVLNNYKWTGGAEVIHMVMDKSFAVVDSFQMGNGYVAETHDFHLLPNGHSLLMAYYLTPVDLSKVVQGSHPNAFIDGAVVQELDSKKNVVFQWRTWDHISTNNIPWNLVPGNTQQIINVFHLNSIRLDNDGNLLLGTPSMGLKISRQSGQVLWVIGGFLNQFTFTNVAQSEALGDFGGHTFQRLANGNILVLDNSPFPWQPGFGVISSEVAEYSINESKKSAELVWKYKPDKVIAGWHAGSVQRLSNGNTFICWGGPPSDGSSLIPIASEVTPNGEKIFELFYEGSELESYRAFRYTLNDGKPINEVTKDQLLALNTYEFKESEKNDTGISIKINAMESVGYNMLIVKKYNYSPAAPEFAAKAPLVIAKRAVLTSFGIPSLDAVIRFDIKSWEINDPGNTKIYFRETENKGVFVPLETTYNFVTGKLTANINKVGEYILAKSDLQSELIQPILNYPANLSKVNYKIPVKMSWSPKGIATDYSLQISRDEDFSSLITDKKLIKEAVHFFSEMQPNEKYYWRVKTRNDAGESPWSETYSFSAVSPFILLKKPNGSEKWNIGLEYYIQWEKNITEAVKVSLTRNDKLVKDLVTTTNLFYLWDVDLGLPLSEGYKIKVTSMLDSSLYDVSDQDFSIVNSSSVHEEEEIPRKFSLEQNYPNPFNSSTKIRFQIAESNFTTLKIFNSIGAEIETLISNSLEKGSYIINWESGNIPSGVYYYKLTSGGFVQTKKLVLLR